MMNTNKRTNEAWVNFNSMFRDAFAREMKTDIYENEKEYSLEVEVPGISKENIEISFEDSTLTIHAKNTIKNDKKNYIAKERTSLDLTRSYYLEEADENKITAKMENGILFLTIGKIENVPNPKKVIRID